ncbi:hypothetical protein GYMLUDRAFT_390721 [Collybiopsis luxurians FD-317 M1]|uniref:Uncharacterized protein n=1 Tax=Collybiopsis luxurians FD-317 M1 TaxID=944289 RepID=A0A0D0BBC1_9AGAR|nr:hypothetical protein GYMLUDRAFT_390721 [Collybiopsis luxurians FD-317 M1]
METGSPPTSFAFSSSLNTFLYCASYLQPRCSRMGSGLVPVLHPFCLAIFLLLSNTV